MRSGNPALNDKIFQNLAFDESNRMTLQGTVVKSAVLLLLVILSASWTWNLYFSTGDAGAVMPYAVGGFLGGLICAFVVIYKKRTAPFLAPVYALLEGLMLGAISGIVQSAFPQVPIVAQAAGLTFAVFGALLFAYMSGLIKPSENMKLGIVAATGGIFLLYIVSIVLGMFGISVGLIHGSGNIAIGFSLFVVVIASLNLVLDFDFIENAVDRGAPKYMEWYGAFGLLVTLVWLYIEILHLLAKLNSRR